MNRKHFVALAHALQNTRPNDLWEATDADDRRAQWNNDVLALVFVCQKSNRLFNRERFLRACGGLYDFNVRASDTVFSFSGIAHGEAAA